MDKLTFLITIRSAERRTYFTLDADYVYFSTWPSSFKIECMLGGEFLCCATDLEGSTDSPLFGLWIIDSFHTEREGARLFNPVFPFRCCCRVNRRLSSLQWDSEKGWKANYFTGPRLKPKSSISTSKPKMDFVIHFQDSSYFTTQVTGRPLPEIGTQVSKDRSFFPIFPFYNTNPSPVGFLPTQLTLQTFS